MKLQLVFVAIVAIALAAVTQVPAMSPSGAETAVSSSTTAPAANNVSTDISVNEGFRISDQRCTAEDCRVCNDNGLICTPEGGECYCDPVIIVE